MIIFLCDVSDSVLFQWMLLRFTCVFILLVVINVYITFLNRLPLIYFQLNVENVGEFGTVSLCRTENSAIQKLHIIIYKRQKHMLL